MKTEKTGRKGLPEESGCKRPSGFIAFYPTYRLRPGQESNSIDLMKFSMKFVNFETHFNRQAYQTRHCGIINRNATGASTLYMGKRASSTNYALCRRLIST